MIMMIGILLFLGGLLIGLIWADPHLIHFNRGEYIGAGLMAAGLLTMAVSAGIFIWNHLP